MKKMIVFTTGAFATLMLLSLSVAAQQEVGPKLLFREIDETVKGNLSEDALLQAKKAAALTALARLKNTVSGSDLYYLAMLESLAGKWVDSANHFQQYLALPQTEDYEGRMNRLTAQGQLREAFANAGLTAAAEKYYANDLISLAMFYSANKQPERALQTYETFLKTDPPPERRRVAKSIILSTLNSMKKVEEAAARLEEYKADLTPNSIINNYSSLARLYQASGDKAKSQKYTELLFAYGKNSKDGKAVDGPLVAHIGWIIERYETAGDAAKLISFIDRLRSEFVHKKAVIDFLNRRDVFDSVLNKPAKELEADYFLNGERTTLKDLHGRVVLLDFFAHWCGPCIKGFPMMRTLLSKYESKGLTILGISGVYGYYQGVQSLTPDKEIERMREQFVKDHQLTWPMVFGRTKVNNENYGVGYIPHLVVIDRKGIVRYAKVGKPDEVELEREVVKLLSESKVERSTEN